MNIFFCTLEINQSIVPNNCIWSHLLQYRKKYSKLDVENKNTLELRDETTKLQLEESDKSGNERIEQIAKKKLNMRNPTNEEKVLLSK